jgi:hypothetical protein
MSRLETEAEVARTMREAKYEQLALGKWWQSSRAMDSDKGACMARVTLVTSVEQDRGQLLLGGWRSALKS